VDLDDLALIEAAAAQNVNLHKNAEGMWEVGAPIRTDPLTPENARQAETFLSGGRIRLPDGRQFPRVMTTEEARKTFGLAPDSTPASS
jgi:hypothetical protein